MSTNGPRGKVSGALQHLKLQLDRAEHISHETEVEVPSADGQSVREHAFALCTNTDGVVPTTETMPDL